MRGATKLYFVLVIALAIAISGCGDDGEETSTTTPTTTATSQAPEPRSQGKTEEAEPKAKQQEEQDGSNSEPAAIPFKAPSGPAPTVSGSLPNEGTKKAAPGVPLVSAAKNGDNSVQTYGLEGPADERVEAARILQAFVNARMAHQWALACSYLSGQVKEQMPLIIDKGQEQRTDPETACVKVMAAFGEGVPKEEFRIAADVNVLSMRVEGEQAIVIYEDGNGTPSTIPMNREGGSWRVAAAAGSVLFLGE